MIKDFSKQIKRLDRLFTIGIASAYHHAEIAARYRKLLGFHFEGVD